MQTNFSTLSVAYIQSHVILDLLEWKLGEVVNFVDFWIFARSLIILLFFIQMTLTKLCCCKEWSVDVVGELWETKCYCCKKRSVAVVGNEVLLLWETKCHCCEGRSVVAVLVSLPFFFCQIVRVPWLIYLLTHQ